MPRVNTSTFCSRSGLLALNSNRIASLFTSTYSQSISSCIHKSLSTSFNHLSSDIKCWNFPVNASIIHVIDSSSISIFLQWLGLSTALCWSISNHMPVCHYCAQYAHTWRDATWITTVVITVPHSSTFTLLIIRYDASRMNWTNCNTVPRRTKLWLIDWITRRYALNNHPPSWRTTVSTIHSIEQCQSQ